MTDSEYHAMLLAAARAETADDIHRLAARLLRDVPVDDPDRSAVGEALAHYRELLGP
jgi:hypothetical protein